MEIINKYYKTILSLLMFIFFAHYIVVFMGVYENDDVAYMRLAHQLSTQHTLNLLSYNHFEHRWITIFFTAIFYKIFGINNYSSAAFGLSCCLITYYIVFKLLDKQSKEIVVIASVLFLFNRATIFHSHRTLADAPMMLLVLLSIINYMHLKFSTQVNQSLQGIAFAVLILLGILTKETIVITTPLWLYLLIVDIKKKQHFTFWLYAIASTLLFTFLYLGIYKILTGQWLYRINILYKNSWINPCSYDVLPVKHTIERITIGLVDSFIHGSYMLLYLPALFCVIYKKQLLNNNDRLWFLCKIYIVLLLCSNFMSVSYKNYMPLCPDSRHFIFLIPIASILSSYMLIAYFNNAKKYFIVAIAFVVVCVRMYCINVGVLKYLYIPATCILLLPLFTSFLKIKYKLNTMWLIVFIAYYAAISLHTFIVSPYPYYAQQKKCIDFLLQQKTPVTLYCNNPETLDNSEYMYKFNKRNIELKLLTTSELNETNNTKNYYLLNYNNNGELIQKAMQCLNNTKVLIKEGNVYLFEINDKEQLKKFIAAQQCINL